MLSVQQDNNMANFSIGTNCTCPPTDELNPLSWQNAFWSLTALALNAMAQVSTADGNDAEIAFSLWRSSPLICIAEILIMTMWAVVGLYYGNTLRDCLSLSRQYLLSEKKRDLDGDGPSNFIALVFFVLVPLPQILKIMASTGVYWTKAWAMAFFLVSVLTFPVMKQRSDADRLRVPMSMETKLIEISHGLYNLSLAIYVLLWIILVVWGTFELLHSLMFSWLGFVWIPIAFLAILWGIFIMPICPSVFSAMFIDIVSEGVYRLRGEQFASVARSDQWTAKAVEPGPWNRSVLWGLVWASWHLIAGLVWYSNYYEESGTTRPSWAEKLG